MKTIRENINHEESLKTKITQFFGISISILTEQSSHIDEK